MNYMDRLFDAVAEKGHVCVGLDTAAAHVPPGARAGLGDAQAALAYNKALIDATGDVAACFKAQIAYYEEMGLAGLSAYAQTLAYAREKGRLIIADVKRGDIAETARAYARAHFSGDFEADFVTLSPYMGIDTLEPWLEEAAARGKGAFVLTRTSNPGARDFQDLQADAPGGKRPLYKAVADRLAELALSGERSRSGERGYGLFGAVVGCPDSRESAEIREKYPNLFFLIPGYGAQGAGASEAALLLREGNGGVVNASRSIIAAWKSRLPESEATIEAAAGCAREAAIEMRDAIRAAIAASAAIVARP
ncbi:MAG: orotidine-5'-phosphate decarboxylase [Treponema sp.]|nr:orotidine-5'-phosphate decarboxylase [Treponema sp.]